MKKILFITVIALFLTACGQTGKLVLPAKTSETTAHP
ncbi:MAG: lipoprotein [Methylococcales bacterium]|nr:lipoprotein [Methylococcales bacterium]MDD5214457.1 lipoprotein [Methylococcales bacterium]